MPAPKPQPLWHLSLTTFPEAEDALTNLLSLLLRQPVSSYLNADSGSLRLNAYLPSLPAPIPTLKQQVSHLLLQVRSHGLNPGPSTIRIRKLPPENWAESWKRHFKPFLIRKKLLVRPSWSRRKALPGQVTVTLDPGLSFGTGHHPTTRFCLDQLTACRIPRHPQSLLDLGTGSGLLAIAAAKLGYQPIRALDNDPLCIRTATQNARLNKTQHRIQFHHLDLKKLSLHPKTRHDIVCANLISTLLIQEKHRIAAQLLPHGTLLLAGILNREAPSVQSQFLTLGLRTIRTQSRHEWTSLQLRHIPDPHS